MTRTTANLLMLITALIWGTTFVAQQLGMSHIGPLTYTGLRFLIGAAVISPLAWREYRRLSAQNIALDRRDALMWCALGGLLFFGAVLQQIGVKYTTVSNSGFLTALYVPLVPVLAWALGHDKPHVTVWPAAVTCLIGTFLLGNGELDSFNVGDLWVIASAFFWAAHVLFVGRIAANKGTPILVAITQFIVCGVLAMSIAPLIEPLEIASVMQAMPAILYGGVLSVGIAFTLQVVAQRHTPASDAAILLSSEILFAAIAGAMYLGERLSLLQWLGGSLIFIAMLGVQLVPLLGGARRQEV
jgi:drug/metabolite transporter (DMT)-like permease